MKRIISLLLILTMVSCYDDYIFDYEYDAVYFAYPVNVRTLVVGEGMQIKFGVSLGGVRENNRDRVVEYQIDNSLITPAILSRMKVGEGYIQQGVAGVTELKPLPSNWYSLSDNQKIVIKKGDHSGAVTFKADSALFLADPSTIGATYALAVKIVKADADSVIQPKSYSVIGLRYENMLFGNYWHGGVTEVKDASGNLLETILYPTYIPSPDILAWRLTTVAPNKLVINGVSNVTSTKSEFAITKNGNNIIVSSVDGATFNVMPDGPSTFNAARLLQDRKIFLQYKYQNAQGNWCHAKDTLTFRNRIRDGVNEWMDENPENYK